MTITRQEAIEVLKTYDMSEDNTDVEFKAAIGKAIEQLSIAESGIYAERMSVADILEYITETESEWRSLLIAKMEIETEKAYKRGMAEAKGGEE